MTDRKLLREKLVAMSQSATYNRTITRNDIRDIITALDAQNEEIAQLRTEKAPVVANPRLDDILVITEALYAEVETLSEAFERQAAQPDETLLTLLKAKDVQIEELQDQNDEHSRTVAQLVEQAKTSSRATQTAYDATLEAFEKERDLARSALAASQAYARQLEDQLVESTEMSTAWIEELGDAVATTRTEVLRTTEAHRQAVEAVERQHEAVAASEKYVRQVQDQLIESTEMSSSWVEELGRSVDVTRTEVGRTVELHRRAAEAVEKEREAVAVSQEYLRQLHDQVTHHSEIASERVEELGGSVSASRTELSRAVDIHRRAFEAVEQEREAVVASHEQVRALQDNVFASAEHSSATVNELGEAVETTRTELGRAVDVHKRASEAVTKERDDSRTAVAANRAQIRQVDEQLAQAAHTSTTRMVDFGETVEAARSGAIRASDQHNRARTRAAQTADNMRDAVRELEGQAAARGERTSPELQELRNMVSLLRDEARDIAGNE